MSSILIFGCEPASKEPQDSTKAGQERAEVSTDEQIEPSQVEPSQAEPGQGEPVQAEPNLGTSTDFFGANEQNQALADQSSVENAPTATSQDNIVADIGFSGAETEPTEPDPPALYCLDNPDQSEITSENACQRISDRLASVSYSGCAAAKLTATGCKSVSGFPILIREFAPIEKRIPQGKILIVGGTHGDELTSVSVVFRWINKLNQYHSGLFHWHVAPLMNPDGVLKREASRTNKNGVDLNRNMPSADWTTNALKYWKNKGNKDPRKFPGESAASEPETQWLIDEINRFEPDAIISVHAPYGVVDFDSLLLNRAPKSLGKLRLNFLGTYPGSLGNYAGINRNIPVITLELPHAWEMPSELESTRIWEDVVSWLKDNINNPEKLANAD